ncbi:MAG: hypothetical protein K5640_03415 [Treponema sp.]|nr:hypothetical protein [Treponema sp.]
MKHTKYFLTLTLSAILFFAETAGPSAIAAATFKDYQEFAASASLTFPFNFEKNDWNNTSKTIRTSGIGGEIQGRIKPSGLPFGFFAQFGFEQPRTIKENRSGTKLDSKHSDYQKIWSCDFQAGTYFLAFENSNWYVPFGFGLHYKLDYNKVTDIETSSNMFGLASFVHGEYRLTDYIWTFTGINICYDFAGGSKRESTSGQYTTVYYNDSGNLHNLKITPKIGLVIFIR